MVRGAPVIWSHWPCWGWLCSLLGPLVPLPATGDVSAANQARTRPARLQSPRCPLLVSVCAPVSNGLPPPTSSLWLSETLCSLLGQCHGSGSFPGVVAGCGGPFSPGCPRLPAPNWVGAAASIGQPVSPPVSRLPARYVPWLTTQCHLPAGPGLAPPRISQRPAGQEI